MRGERAIVRQIYCYICSLIFQSGCCELLLHTHTSSSIIKWPCLLCVRGEEQNETEREMRVSPSNVSPPIPSQVEPHTHTPNSRWYQHSMVRYIVLQMKELDAMKTNSSLQQEWMRCMQWKVSVLLPLLTDNGCKDAWSSPPDQINSSPSGRTIRDWWKHHTLWWAALGRLIM